METIDHVYYINLDHRVDRRLQFEDWIEESGFPMDKVTRISAVYAPNNGALGCSLSHIKTLEIFLNSSNNNCLLLEDDYIPLDIKTFWENFRKIKENNIDYDIIMGSYNNLEYEDTSLPFLKKVIKSLTTSSYLVTRDFAPKLIENYKESVRKKIEIENITRKKEDEFSLDVYWQKLMPISKWFCFYPRIGKQYASYSDIQGHFTDYNA